MLMLIPTCLAGLSILLLTTGVGTQFATGAPLPDCVDLNGAVAQPNPVEKDGGGTPGK